VKAVEERAADRCEDRGPAHQSKQRADEAVLYIKYGRVLSRQMITHAKLDSRIRIELEPMPRSSNAERIREFVLASIRRSFLSIVRLGNASALQSSARIVRNVFDQHAVGARDEQCPTFRGDGHDDTPLRIAGAGAG